MEKPGENKHWAILVANGLFRLALFVIFTVMTQIGGFTYLISTLLAHILKVKSLWKRILANLITYSIATFVLVPLLAPVFGRVPITITDNLSPTNYVITVGLNRHYVVPELNKVLDEISDSLYQQSPNTVLFFLDANFPFIDNFPLLPHLSHNDGKKVDFSFIYEYTDGTTTDTKPSISGYGVFESPRQGEKDTTKMCKDQGYSQYDYPKYLTLGKTSEQLEFSEKWNRILLENIISNPKIKKVFIEPHLLKRLNLGHPKIRFQGCKAVRHDDHIHIQI